MKRLVMGGQGRSETEITNSAELCGWLVLAAVIVALACLTGCAANVQRPEDIMHSEIFLPRNAGPIDQAAREYFLATLAAKGENR